MIVDQLTSGILLQEKLLLLGQVQISLVKVQIIIKIQYFSINILTIHTFCDKIGIVKVNFAIFGTDFHKNENYK